ncbi:MAG: siphovirus Gp157 family protein [Candidatus Paceibacterota bacterium]
MTKIFELKAQQQELLDQLFFLDDEEDASEIDYIKLNLDSIVGDVEHKLRYLSEIYIEADGQEKLSAYAFSIGVDRLTKDIRRKQRVKERLKDFILETMKTFDIKKVKGDLCSLSRSESQGSVVIDETFKDFKLPDDCIEKIPASFKILKTEIAKHLKAGEEIPGCSLVKKQILRLS